MLHQLAPRVRQFIDTHVTTADDATRSPILVIDLDEVRNAYEAFRRAFPRVTPHYAMKANPQRPILETLRDLGSNYDVASVGEIQELRDIGVAPNRMIYANPVKAPNAIEAALRGGVTMMTADSVEELDKIAEVCRRLDKQVGVLVRIWVPNYGSVVDLSAKFGADEETTTRMFRHVREQDLPINMRGLAFHVGSQCLNPANFKKAFKLALDQTWNLRADGHKIDMLDIGGGLPVNYSLQVSYVEDVVEGLRDELDRVPRDIDVIAEPGRAFCATAATLVTQIIGKTERNGKLWYYIDDSIYSTFSGKIFDFTDYRFHPLDRDANPGREVTIAGCSCDGHDIISIATTLPGDLQIGDFLVAPNVGAYTNASASAFNGFTPAHVHCVPLSEPVGAQPATIR